MCVEIVRVKPRQGFEEVPVETARGYELVDPEYLANVIE